MQARIEFLINGVFWNCWWLINDTNEATGKKSTL
jgi:hypothetical protein